MIPAHITSLILDMDGVIWKADAPIGDLAAIFNRIRAFIGNENFEERTAPRGAWIDKPVMKYLTKKFGG